jgi:hypothetical protein
MEKRLLFLFVIVSIFTACNKNDDHLFQQSPDERLNAAISSYQSKLTSAEYGWKALITVNGGNGGVYSFYFKFNDQNRVMMLSDFDSASAVTKQESSFRIKAEQQPTLIFDTYSYVHILADPNENTIDVQAVVNPGPVGAGLLSDFEFFFDSAKVQSDSMVLIGKVNHSVLKLTKATKTEADGFNTGQLGAAFSLNKILTYFKRLTIASVSSDFYFDEVTRTFRIQDNNGNLLDSTKIFNYYHTLNGIGFTKSIVVGNQIISRLDNLNFSSTTQTINCTVNGTSATVTGLIIPSKVDANAPRRWWNNAGSTRSYYGSLKGFHVNGIDDAFKLNSIPGYGFLYFEPRFGIDGNVTYDLLAPIINDSLKYGAAFSPPTFTGSLAVFTYYGDLGSIPSSQIPIYTSMVLKMIDPSGFYLVQTGGAKYDMVSARDGKSWIRWE